MVSNPSASASDAQRFLETLAPSEAFTFQTFDDAKTGRGHLSRVLHGSHHKHCAALRRLNDEGAGVFVMVNRGDGKARRNENVVAVRTVFIDLDGAPLEPVTEAPIKPAIVCESSPGKYHAYWPVFDLALHHFKSAQRALATRFGGDPAVCDLARVMRLPGYLHNKGEPFATRLLHCDPTAPLHWQCLADAFELHTKSPATVNTDDSPEQRNSTLFAFACSLRGQGVDLSEAERRLKALNARKFQTPLDAREVAEIVTNAWKGANHSFVRLYHDVLDSPEFRALPESGKVALIALCRNFNGRNNGCITFTRTEALAWGLSKHRRSVGLTAAEAAGLIEYTQRGMPEGPGHARKTDRFRVAFLDRVNRSPYPPRRIGQETAPPLIDKQGLCSV